MNRLLAPVLVALAVAVLSTPGSADTGQDTRGAQRGAAPAAAAMADGVIKKVDKPGGKLVISHGPLPNGMAGMTMAFRVKEPGWLDQLKEGDRIRFAIDDAMTVVRVERVK